MLAHKRIAGVDEAGRGPLAGAVYAAAVVLDPNHTLELLDDSKKLSAKKRAYCEQWIKEHALDFAVATADVAEIDTLNILQASLLAMRRSIDALACAPDELYVDGNQSPKHRIVSQCFVGGDSLHKCISAASILAKEARDRNCLELEAQYPGYGFAQHKGYPTKMHLQALQRLGPCAAHRLSYKPVQRLINKV